MTPQPQYEAAEVEFNLANRISRLPSTGGGGGEGCVGGAGGCDGGVGSDGEREEGGIEEISRRGRKGRWRGDGDDDGGGDNEDGVRWEKEDEEGDGRKGPDEEKEGGEERSEAGHVEDEPLNQISKHRERRTIHYTIFSPCNHDNLTREHLGVHAAHFLELVFLRTRNVASAVHHGTQNRTATRFVDA